MRHAVLLGSICVLAMPWLVINAQEEKGRPAPRDSSATNGPGLVVEDAFGRVINERGVTLVDWEGYIANPAIKIYLTPPLDMSYPAKAVLTAKEPRLYFDLPSTTGPGGPRKEIVWQSKDRLPVYISIFPDRDGEDEEHRLFIDFKDANGHSESLDLPIHVIDQDRERAEDFHITVDFSQDRTGFFADETKRKTIIRAARDWAYFFADMQLRAVSAGSEKTLIWGPDGFKKASHVFNANEYTGYLLYAYGIRNELLNPDAPIPPAWKAMSRNPAARNIRSGGEPSFYGGFQVAAGTTKPIRRSGGLEIEVQGNYNTLGWLVTLEDRDWWQATNHGDVINDLYSIAHHEIGHALIFNPNNKAVKRSIPIVEKRLNAYLATWPGPALSQSDHLEGYIDPESLRGAFGNEYHGKMPRGRWLITKADLLFAQAIGYELRPTSALAPLTFAAANLPKGNVAAPYSAKLQASGGIPLYCWDTLDPLPDGLSLDSYTAEISGTPKQAGDFLFTVRVRDNAARGRGLLQRCRMRIDGDK